MKIIDIINNVSSVVGLDQFTSVYGTDDDNARTMIELCQEGGKEISRRVDWRYMLMTATIATSGSSLPTDFQRLIPGGAVRTAAGDFVRPSTNGSEWALISRIPSSQAFFFLTATDIRFSPASAGVNSAMDYVSKNWLTIAAGGYRDTILADDDAPRFPGSLLEKNLMWRWRRQKGLAYDDHLAEFEADLVTEIKSNRGLA